MSTYKNTLYSYFFYYYCFILCSSYIYDECPFGDKMYRATSNLVIESKLSFDAELLITQFPTRKLKQCWTKRERWRTKLWRMVHVGNDRVWEKSIKTEVTYTHGSALVLMLLCMSSVCFCMCVFVFIHTCVCVFTVKQVLEHVAAIITTTHGQCMSTVWARVCLCKTHLSHEKDFFFF